MPNAMNSSANRLAWNDMILPSPSTNGFLRIYVLTMPELCMPIADWLTRDSIAARENERQGRGQFG